jgi:hypothetical protein
VVIVSVVVGGGGGGGAVCVAEVAVAECVISPDAALACPWCLCLWAGLATGAVVVVVTGVVGVVGVVAAFVAAAALGVVFVVEVEDADPHALTSSASSTAIAGVRRSFMCCLPAPQGRCLVYEDAASRE